MIATQRMCLISSFLFIQINVWIFSAIYSMIWKKRISTTLPWSSSLFVFSNKKVVSLLRPRDEYNLLAHWTNKTTTTTAMISYMIDQNESQRADSERLRSIGQPGGGGHHGRRIRSGHSASLIDFFGLSAHKTRWLLSTSSMRTTVGSYCRPQQ